MPFLRDSRPPFSISAWYSGDGTLDRRLGVVSRDLADIHRRIHRITFQRASGVGQSHAACCRIQNHEKVQGLSTIPISRGHEALRPNTFIDGLDRSIRKERIRGRACWKLAVVESRSKDPFVLAGPQRMRVHDTYSR